MSYDINWLSLSRWDSFNKVLITTMVSAAMNQSQPLC